MEIVRNEDLDCELQIIKNDVGEIWFRGKTVCDSLGYADSKKALSLHVRQKHQKRMGDVKGGNLPPLIGNTKNTIFINEPGLYSLIMKSKMPQAEAFQDWVYEEVLPSLRKTGKYEMNTGAHQRLKEPHAEKLKITDDIENLRDACALVDSLNLEHNHRLTLIKYIENEYELSRLNEAKAKIKLIEKEKSDISKLPVSLKMKETLNKKMIDEFKVTDERREPEYLGWIKPYE